jgi:hypothetical protein
MLARRSVSSGTPPAHLACSRHRPSVPSSDVIRVTLTSGLARDLTAEALDLESFQTVTWQARPCSVENPRPRGTGVVRALIGGVL